MYKLLKQAFTLIELLVVIAIIGILSGLIIVTMSETTNRATIANARVFSNSLRNSIMINMVSEWKINEGLGTSISDSLGGVNTGSLTGTYTWKGGLECVDGSCLSFSGAGRISLGTSSSLNVGDNFTVEAWIYPLSIANGPAIIGKNGYSGNRGWLFLITSTGRIRFEGSPDGTNIYGFSSATGIVNLNKWQHIVFVKNSTNGVFYLNGAIIAGTGTLYSQYFNSSNVGMIGAYGGGGDGNMIGSIDTIRIYNAAIPTSHIKEQYYAGLNKLLANGGITQGEYQSRIGELAIAHP